MSKFVGQSCAVLSGGQIVGFRRDKDGKSAFVTVDCDTLEVATFETKEQMNQSLEDREWQATVAKREATRAPSLVESILDAPDKGEDTSEEDSTDAAEDGPKPQQPRF